MSVYTILTEENPSVEEINFIIKHILCIESQQSIIIYPVVNDKIFNGEWIINLDEFSITIIMKLFRGLF